MRHVYAAPRDLPTNWINTIVQSADGAVWVGSNRGLFHFRRDPSEDAYRIRAYSTSEGADEVWGIAQDRQQNLWLGRKPSGVARLWHRGLTGFGAADGLSASNSINATRNGDVIAVSALDVNRWCLCRFDGMKFVASRFPGQDVSPGWGWSQMVLQDRTGDWWIGTDSGLFCFTNRTTIGEVERSSPSAIYTTRDGLAGTQVLRLFEDSRSSTCGSERSAAPARAVALAAEDRHLPPLHRADGLPRLDQSYIAVLCKGLGDFLDVVTLSPRERQGNAESFPGPGRVQSLFLPEGLEVVETIVMLGVLN